MKIAYASVEVLSITVSDGYQAALRGMPRVPASMSWSTQLTAGAIRRRSKLAGLCRKQVRFGLLIQLAIWISRVSPNLGIGPRCRRLAVSITTLLRHFGALLRRALGIS